MSAILATLAIVVTIQGGQGSLLRQIVPNPTGANGYEEYLMACDVVRNTGVRWLVDASPEQIATVVDRYEAPGTAPEVRPSEVQYQMAKRYRGLNVLALRREAVRLAKPAMELVAKGNRKKAYDPRTDIGWDVLYPEFSEMRVLGKLAVSAAYVAHADGNPQEATTLLMDAFHMSNQIGKGVLISRLVAIAIQSSLFSAYETYLPLMTFRDAERIRDFAKSSISDPPSVVASIDAEYAFMQRHVKTMFNRVEDANGFLFTEDKASNAEKTASDFLQKMSAADKQRVIRLCENRLQRQRTLLIASYRRPEREWETPVESEANEFPMTRAVKSVEDFADFINSMTVPAFSQIGALEIRNRTQFRILGLTAAIVKFKWEHNRLPNRLEDVVGMDEIQDPANGGQFQYEASPTGFRVYSQGTKSSGEIGLRYSNARPGQDIPPPIH